MIFWWSVAVCWYLKLHDSKTIIIKIEACLLGWVSKRPNIQKLNFIIVFRLESINGFYTPHASKTVLFVFPALPLPPSACKIHYISEMKFTQKLYICMLKKLEEMPGIWNLRFSNTCNILKKQWQVSLKFFLSMKRNLYFV